MRILIVGATNEQLAAAARLRRLYESAKIIVLDEAAESPGTAYLRRRYRIDLRPYTRFISADMGYSNVATLEDTLTRHVYQEEFDKIINSEPDANIYFDIQSAQLDLDGHFDTDIAAHIRKHTQNFVRVEVSRHGGPCAVGRRVADEIYGTLHPVADSVEIKSAEITNLKLIFFGWTEQVLNAHERPFIYSILPVAGGFVKLIYDDGGEILGFYVLAQPAIAHSCADILSTLAKLGGTVQSMVQLELTDTRHPLITLGKIAQNVIEKRLHMAYADEISNTAQQDIVLLDVRPHTDYITGHIDSSINIPLEALRESMYRLERQKEIITICEDGKESYLAARILMGHGFKTRQLTGGLSYARPIIWRG